MSSEISLPRLAIHLHKQIPIGAGLGGGSSNASTIIKGLNLLAGSPLSPEKLAKLAAELGSDCPYFLHQVPMMMEGRGDLLSPVKISLDDLYLVLLFPEIHISTSEAYQGITPAVPAAQLEQLIETPIEQWRGLIINDFEKSAFEKHPRLKELKEFLYRVGASYASMSGSGSSLYGIFKSPPKLPAYIQRYVIWKGSL